MTVRVGFELTYNVPYPSPLLFVVEPRDRPTQRVVSARRSISPDVPLGAFRSYLDGYGNVVWRVLPAAGTLRVTHDLVIEVAAQLDPVLLDLPKTPLQDLPDDVLLYTLPSRYCPSDLFIRQAWDLFGHIEGGWAQAQAVCDHLFENVAYAPGSDATTTAHDAYRERVAVCRDFAHLGVAFCRALNLPARYVCGYLPDIWIEPPPVPMDFHAWFEVFLDGAWRTFDARYNVPRAGRVLIAAGRDAADVAFSTSYGSTRLETMRVWADEIAPAELAQTAPTLTGPSPTPPLPQ